MDRERWPDAILAFVGAVVCPKCSAPRELVMVTVRYQAPVWNIVSNCMSCRFVHLWQHLGLEPRPKAESESTPLPAWVKEL